MEKKRKKQRQKNLFTVTLGGFVIVVTNKCLNDSKVQRDDLTYNVTSFGSDDLSLNQSGTSIQILPEPNVVT